jgi:hypothetical protein
MGTYDTNKHKHILITTDTKDKLDGVMIDMKKKMSYDKIVNKLMDLYYLIDPVDIKSFMENGAE